MDANDLRYLASLGALFALLTGCGGGTKSAGCHSNADCTGAASTCNAAGACVNATPPMPILSLGVPAFASSSSNTSAGPEKANDGNPATSWVSASLPAWLAYDLSGASAASRQSVLVAWYAYRTEDFINTPAPFMNLPEDYTIEINSAAGGGPAPATGWTQAATVTGNVNSGRHHLVALNGANWVRMKVTKASDPNNVGIDLDVHGTPSGPSDSWLFLGDSITFISLPRAFSDLPKLVHTDKPSYYPAIIDAAIGGTSTVNAVAAIDATMANFPGRFVALDYGTNDKSDQFQMESLITKVIAAGKIPVVPHMPWSDQRLTLGPALNAQIDALYTKYPQVVRGPDLWAAFLNRTDLIPSGDVHPNSAGQEVLRMQWAAAMEKIYQ